MLTLDLVAMDTTDWKEHEHTPTNRSWYVAGDAIRFRLLPGPCLEDTVLGWRQRAARETAADGGTCLAFDEISIDGCIAFQGVFKFPAARVIPQLPRDVLAVYIVGLTAVPLGDAHLMLNAEALERGTTGGREAAYGVLQPKPTGEPVQIGGMEDYFGRVRSSLGAALPSDAPEFDALAPSHPLSRVRAYQRTLGSQLRFAPELRSRARPVQSGA